MTTRIHILDELRGVCVVLMVLYHAMYTVGMMFAVGAVYDLFVFFSPLEPLFAGLFILLCGFSCRLSKNNLKRGGLLLLVALAMTAVLWIVMPSQLIVFGVLHCLAVCILLFVLLRPLLDRVPVLAGIILSAVLFLLTWRFPFANGGMIGFPPFALTWPQEWQDIALLIPLGIGKVTSADYFPLIPWVFCFLGGTFLGRLKDRLPPWCYRSHCRPLSIIGRHSLLIYLAHQPLIFAAAALITYLM